MVYAENSTDQCSMEEAMLYFFYNGISPWVTGAGYTWSIADEKVIAQKFLKFTYQVCCALKDGPNVDLYMTSPNHRDLEEDRDTFDIYADMTSFIDVLEQWRFRTEIVGTRMEYLIREFCYAWVDVTRGKPGRWTQASLDMGIDYSSDEDAVAYNPDSNLNRRKYDLY